MFDESTKFYQDTYSTGTVPDKQELVDQTIEPMYATEFIATYDWIENDWNLGVALTYRELSSTIEDVAIDAAIAKYCTANNIDGCPAIWDGFHHYVLTNPGTDLVYETNELPGETGYKKVKLTAAQLNYPEVERVYQALDFTFSKSLITSSFFSTSQLNVTFELSFSAKGITLFFKASPKYVKANSAPASASF